jgi:hypothetical protein
VTTGPAGSAGQVAKLCNNLILGITMIGVSEVRAGVYVWCGLVHQPPARALAAGDEPWREARH